MWFATGTSVKYLIIPDKYADITKATGYTFWASGIVITGNYHFGFVDQVKAFASLTVISSNLQAGAPARTVAVEFQDDDDGVWTSLGTLNTSPIQTLYFPADTTGKKLKLRFTLATADSTLTPVIKAYALHGLVAWQRKKQFRFVVRVGSNLRTIHGKVDETLEQVLAGYLKYFGDQAYITMYVSEETTAGAKAESTYYIRFLDMQEQWAYDEVGKRPERHFSVNAVEVRLS